SELPQMEGKMSKRGVDSTVNGDIISTRESSWHLSCNIPTLKNRVTESSEEAHTMMDEYVIDVRIKANEWYVPACARAHPGSEWVVRTCTSNMASDGCGLTVPSICPMRLRGVASGSSAATVERWKPGSDQRTRAWSRVRESRCPTAVLTTTGSSAATCNMRSPSHHSDTRWSVSKSGSGSM